MNTVTRIHNRFSLIAALAILAASLIPQVSFAKAGATDPIPGTSKSGVSTGGAAGGKKSSTVTPAPTPPPAPAPGLPAAIVAPLTFTTVLSYGGVIPQCSGSYNIDPYYPTLSLMTVNLHMGSVNMPDGSLFYVTIRYSNGTLYPFTSNAVLITTGAGSCAYSAYVTPGTTILGIDVSDSTGAVVSTGN